MKKVFVFLVLGLLIVSISGCTQNTQTSDSSQQSSEGELIKSTPKLATKELSEMALQLEDLPENYTMRTRTERVKSEISQEGVSLGWKNGYYVHYLWMGDKTIEILGSEVPIEYTGIEQAISIYPIENISKLLVDPTESTENVTYEEYSNPNIGDESRAYRVTFVDEYDTETTAYAIEFIKMDVYEYILMSGTITDYELLKEIAKTTEKKIK